VSGEMSDGVRRITDSCHLSVGRTGTTMGRREAYSCTEWGMRTRFAQETTPEGGEPGWSAQGSGRFGRHARRPLSTPGGELEVPLRLFRCGLTRIAGL